MYNSYQSSVKISSQHFEIYRLLGFALLWEIILKFQEVVRIGSPELI